MASSQQRVIHQDYIARIRYSNALPPPPNPPKLLDIPNTGLASGQYTTPGFASRLARDQPLNIEADAELGMPLDLVGMPGIFDGDESCKSSPKSSRRKSSPSTKLYKHHYKLHQSIPTIAHFSDLYQRLASQHSPILAYLSCDEQSTSHPSHPNRVSSLQHQDLW